MASTSASSASAQSDAPSDDGAFPHTRALLHFLLQSYPPGSTGAPQRHQRRALDASPPSLAFKHLLLDDPPTSNDEQHKDGSMTSSATPSESADDDSEAASSAAAPSAAGEQSNLTTVRKRSHEDRINRVLEVLRSDELDDEDRPERLKAVLRDELGVIEPPSHLDAVVLGLLHRFNEDEKPSGVALEPLTAFAPRDPARPSSSMSRSSSFRRNFKAQLPASLVNLQRSAAGPPHSGNSSPFRSPAGSPSHSPWSSPRPAPLSLNATAAEFKLAGGSSSSRARSRSPLPQSHGNALHSPGPSSATWAFQSSPLGTPKYAPGSAASSYTASGSYFPAPAKSSALAQSASQQSAIPRNPWAEDGEDDPIPTLERSSSPTQWSQTSSEDPTNFLPSTLFTNASPADQPVIDDSGVFDAGALDGSANASFDSQGASDFYDASPAQANPYTQPWSGLHGGADNYNMTPFDVLYSRFAGTGVTPDALEEALAMTGWDIDRAIEFVVERHQLDSSLLEADGTRRQGSSYLGSRSGTSSPVPRLAGPPHAHQQSPLGAASGSRPLVVSRDSLYRAGRGDSPDPNGRWRSPGASPMGTPRSGTPTRGLGGRVCRYYLNGACLRADCKYSHDVSRAVCKFWLNGGCIKGKDRCDFLHAIPPNLPAAQRAQLTMRRRAVE